MISDQRSGHTQTGQGRSPTAKPGQHPDTTQAYTLHTTQSHAVLSSTLPIHLLVAFLVGNAIKTVNGALY